MSIPDFFPIVSNNLSVNFPELRHFILTNYMQSSMIKKGREITFNSKEDLIYLANGKVKAYLYDQDGHERMLYIFIKDTMIFQSVSPQFYKKLIVYEGASIYYVEKNLLFSFLQTDPIFIEKYTEIIASRYGILMQQILSNDNQCAKQKVISFLYSLTFKFGERCEDGTFFITKFPSLTDIGALTNVHRTNVSAYINELESLNIISRKEKKLIVNDIDMLKKMLNNFSS